MKDKINIYGFGIVYGLLSWIIMFPLLLINYIIFEKQYLHRVNFLSDPVFFGIITIIFAFVGILWINNIFISPLISGLTRYLFIWIMIFLKYILLFIYKPLGQIILIGNWIPLMISELFIMILSYYIGYYITFKLHKRLFGEKN